MCRSRRGLTHTVESVLSCGYGIVPGKGCGGLDGFVGIMTMECYLVNRMTGCWVGNPATGQSFSGRSSDCADAQRAPGVGPGGRGSVGG